MSANKKDMARYLGDEPDDDLPDFSTDEWAKAIEAAPASIAIAHRMICCLLSPTAVTTVSDPKKIVCIKSYWASVVSWNSSMNK